MGKRFIYLPAAITMASLRLYVQCCNWLMLFWICTKLTQLSLKVHSRGEYINLKKVDTRPMGYSLSQNLRHQRLFIDDSRLFS